MEQSGGAFNEQGCHFVDLQRYLGGEIEWVHAARSHHLTGEPGDAYAVTTGFANGATGTLFYSCRGNEKDIGFHIHHARGPIMLDGWDLALSPAALNSHGEPVEAADAVFLKETVGFFEALMTGDSSHVRSDIGDAVRTQQVVCAIHISATTGERVYVDRVIEADGSRGPI